MLTITDQTVHRSEPVEIIREEVAEVMEGPDDGTSLLSSIEEHDPLSI
jgi:hypothetical protein